jgi:transforming growth factor-beta-induced protein
LAVSRFSNLISGDLSMSLKNPRLAKAVIALALVAAAGLTVSTLQTQRAARAEDATPAAPKDIVDTAVAAGSFKTLVAAVQAAGLVETLKSAGPFTVFAPTDEAFAKLPAGTVESLLKPENKDQLVKILTYHVVPGKVTAADVVKLDSAKTVQGGSLTIKVSDGKVYVDNAQVIKADILTSNGVIHVIDTVVMPK